MVERALSMGEVEGSMPSFSNRKLVRVIASFGSWCRELLHTMASDKVLLWPALRTLFFPENSLQYLLITPTMHGKHQQPG